jgi:hypothetical protein
MASLVSSLGIARKVGEGYDRPNAEYEVPIDINYARLAEWLVSKIGWPLHGWFASVELLPGHPFNSFLSQVDRKQVPTDWNRKLQALQAKAAEALKELPPGFLGQFEGVV